MPESKPWPRRWAEIGQQSGMARKALRLLFQRAKELPVTAPLTVPARKPGSGYNNVKLTRPILLSMRRVVLANPKLTARQIKSRLPTLKDVSMR